MRAPEKKDAAGIHADRKLRGPRVTWTGRQAVTWTGNYRNRKLLEPEVIGNGSGRDWKLSGPEEFSLFTFYQLNIYNLQYM